MSAVLQEPRQLTKREVLSQQEYKAQSAMLRMRAATFDVAVARIEMSAGECEVGSGLRVALLEYKNARADHLEALNQITNLRQEVLKS